MGDSNIDHINSKKRRRGPYLSYLVNDPLLSAVPKSTLKSWSQAGEHTSGTTPHAHPQESNFNESPVFTLDECEDSNLQTPTCEINELEFPDDAADNPNADICLETDYNSFNSYNLPCEIPEPVDLEMQESIDYFNHYNSLDNDFMDDNSDDENETFYDTQEEEDIEDVEDMKKGHTTDEQKTNGPLYTGCSLTMGMSMLLIITFAMRHQLTGSALSDLLTLINIHLLTPNSFSKSLATLQKFFTKLKNPIEFHYYCNFCFEYIGPEKKKHCINKHCLCDLTKKENLGYFIVIPLEHQLQALLSRPEMKDLLSYRSSRKKENADNIEDIFDGRLYKRHFDQEHFKGTDETQKNSELHISLQINTDGVSLFRSSTFSIWPVYYVVNELPPNCRFHRKNRLFAGLWFGTKKPHFPTFLQPFALSLRSLFHKGTSFSWHSHKENHRVRCLLLCGSFDAPAKCLFQSLIQFNGWYGCPYCLEPGASVKTSERGSTHAYPFNTENIKTGHAQKRTHEQTLSNAKIATTRLLQTGKAEPEKGVRGYSWFVTVPGFDIIRGVGIDYMHSVLLGVVKMLFNLWLDKQHHLNPWYLGKHAKEIERRYISIKPPSCISRLPRSLIGNLGHLKASELRSLLLFYSVPCLFGLLPDVYFQHYILLVEAIFLLLQTSISRLDLVKSSKLLRHFCLCIEELYGSRYQTSNVHGLLHLVDKVRDLGPLWTHSCFCFEDFNGELRHMFHGTQNVEMQIVLSICIQQKIPELIPLLPPGSRALEFYEMLTSKTRICQNKKDIDENISIVGAISNRFTLPIYVKHLIETEVGNLQVSFKFKRISIDGKIFHCKEYRPGMRRNNFTIKYNSNVGPKYGQILYFVKCYTDCTNPVFCSENCSCNKPIYRAVIAPLEKEPNNRLSTDTVTGATVSHIVPVKLISDKVLVIPLQMIDDVFVYIDCNNDGISFVARFPNMFEKD